MPSQPKAQRRNEPAAARAPEASSGFYDIGRRGSSTGWGWSTRRDDPPSNRPIQIEIDAEFSDAPGAPRCICGSLDAASLSWAGRFGLLPRSRLDAGFDDRAIIRSRAAAQGRRVGRFTPNGWSVSRGSVDLIAQVIGPLGEAVICQPDGVVTPRRLGRRPTACRPHEGMLDAEHR